MARLVRVLAVAGGLVAVWQLVVWITGAPPYILPGPAAVVVAWADEWRLILDTMRR